MVEGLYPLDLLVPVRIGQVAMANLIVKAAVKEAMNDKNVSADFYDALDDRVSGLLAEAEGRADANGRKTVQPRDL